MPFAQQAEHLNMLDLTTLPPLSSPTPSSPYNRTTFNPPHNPAITDRLSREQIGISNNLPGNYSQVNQNTTSREMTPSIRGSRVFSGSISSSSDSSPDFSNPLSSVTQNLRANYGTQLSPAANRSPYHSSPTRELTDFTHYDDLVQLLIDTFSSPPCRQSFPSDLSSPNEFSARRFAKLACSDIS